MNKKEMINEVALRAEGLKKDAEKYIECVLGTIEDAVASGDTVKIVGFGTFKKKVVKGRTGAMYFGDKKGQEWTTEDSYRVSFKPGKDFTNKVKGIVSEDIKNNEDSEE